MTKEQQIHHLSYNNKSRLNDSEEHLYEVIDSSSSATPSAANLRQRIMLNTTDKKGHEIKSDDLSFPSCIKNDQVMAKKFSLGEKTLDVDVVQLDEEKQKETKNNLIPVKEIIINGTNKELEFCLHSSAAKAPQKVIKTDTRLSNYTCLDTREDDDDAFNTYNEPQQGFYKCHKNLSDIDDFDIVPDFRYRMNKNRYLVSSGFTLNESQNLRNKKLSKMYSLKNIEDVDNKKGSLTQNLNGYSHETSKIFLDRKCNMTASSSTTSSSCHCINFCSSNKNIREGGYSDGKNSISLEANFTETMNKFQPRRQKSNHISNTTETTLHCCVAKNYYRTCSTLSLFEDSGNSSMSEECSVEAAYNNSLSSRNDFTPLNDKEKHRIEEVPSPSFCFSSNDLSKHNLEDVEKLQKCDKGIPMPPNHEAHPSFDIFFGLNSFVSSRKNNQFKSVAGNGIKQAPASSKIAPTSPEKLTTKIKDDTDFQILHTLKSDKNLTTQSRSQFHGAHTHLNIQHSSNYNSSKEHEDRCHSKLASNKISRYYLKDRKEQCSISVNNSHDGNILKLDYLKQLHNLDAFIKSLPPSPPPLPPKPLHSCIKHSENSLYGVANHKTFENIKLDKHDTTKTQIFTSDTLGMSTGCDEMQCTPRKVSQLNLDGNLGKSTSTSLSSFYQPGNDKMDNDSRVNEIRNIKNKNNKSFIASYKNKNKRQLAQSVHALQKLSYDLLGLIDDQQKTHLRQYDGRIESNISDILETEFGVKDNNRLKFCEENLITMENNLEIIRANKEDSGKNANKHKVKESAESQRIHGNISLSTKNDPCIENGKERSTIQKELSCKTNNTTKRDSALHFSHERVNQIKNSVKSDKCILKFSRDGMQLSDVKKPSNSNSDLLLHSRTEQNLSNGSEENCKVDSRRKLIFSPASDALESHNDHQKMEDKRQLTSQDVLQGGKYPFVKRSFKDKQPFKHKYIGTSLKKRRYPTTPKPATRKLISRDRITRKRSYMTKTKDIKSSKLGHISFIESLRSTSFKESPISDLIKNRILSSAKISENTEEQDWPRANDTEKTFFDNHSFEDFKSYSEEKGESNDDCTPISSLKSACFQSFYSPHSTPFTFLFRRRRNSTPLKGHSNNKYRKEIFKMLEKDNSSKSLKQKINGGGESSLLFPRMDLRAQNRLNKTTALKGSKYCAQHHNTPKKTMRNKHSFAHNMQKTIDKNGKKLGGDSENKENQEVASSHLNKTRLEWEMKYGSVSNLPIIPFQNTSDNLPSSPFLRTNLIKRSPSIVQYEQQKGSSFDTYIEMTPKCSSELTSSHLQKLNCQSRKSFLISTHKNDVSSSSVSKLYCLRNNDCISKLNEIVLESNQKENQFEAGDMAMHKGSKCNNSSSENNNLHCNLLPYSSSYKYTTRSVRETQNVHLKHEMAPKIELIDTHSPIKPFKNHFRQNQKQAELKLEFEGLNKMCSQPYKDDKCDTVINDENQNQQPYLTCNNIDKLSHSRQLEKLLHGVGISSKSSRQVGNDDTQTVSTNHQQDRAQSSDEKVNVMHNNGNTTYLENRVGESEDSKSKSCMNKVKDDSSTKIYLNIDDYVKMGNISNFCF